MALRSVSKKSLGLGLGLGLAQLGHVRGLQSFSLPDLPYDYGALEPVISGEIMQLHHQKHHQTYITNYNKALDQLDQALAKSDSSSIVQLQSAIKFNGGGFILSLSVAVCILLEFISLIKLRISDSFNLIVEFSSAS
jgi:Fe-Mn family superoxide dismutase